MNPTTPGQPQLPTFDLKLEYEPGVCNIGPDEIARRWQAGHVALLATVGLLGGLQVIGAPPIARALVALPAAGAASGYLQARLRFCAGFGGQGVFNFGALGQQAEVVDDAAKAADRRMATRIGLASAAIGGGVAGLAVLLSR